MAWNSILNLFYCRNIWFCSILGICEYKAGYEQSLNLIVWLFKWQIRHAGLLMLLVLPCLYIVMNILLRWGGWNFEGPVSVVFMWTNVKFSWRCCWIWYYKLSCLYNNQNSFLKSNTFLCFSTLNWQGFPGQYLFEFKKFRFMYSITVIWIFDILLPYCHSSFTALLFLYLILFFKPEQYEKLAKTWTRLCKRVVLTTLKL